MTRYVIVGGGIASVNAARVLRDGDPEGDIVIISDESRLPYGRPQLIDYLAGKINVDKIRLHDADWYKRTNVEIALGTEAVRIDPAARVVFVNKGGTTGPIKYDRLLLTTGGAPFLPPIQGIDTRGVFTLRTVEDVDAIHEYANARVSHAVVIGGGLLGLEAAKALSSYGLEVTVIEHHPRLLPRQLDQDGAFILKRRIEDTGLHIILGIGVKEIEGNPVKSVKLEDGRTIDAGLVLISAGIRPRVEIAVQAGIQCNRGIKVDSRLRTSMVDIWAAGDAAEYEGTVYGIIPAALDQSMIAARNMAGVPDLQYTGTTPVTSLKVTGIDLVSVGIVNPEGEGFRIVKAVDETKGTYKKAVLKDSRLVGAIFLGDTQEAAKMTNMIRERLAVDERTLFASQ